MKNACNNQIGGASARTSPSPLFTERHLPRIHGLDVLRGLCIILMIFDHLAFDLWWFFDGADHVFLQKLQEIADAWWLSTLRLCLRLPVIVIFFTISGICSSFSHNNFMRGAKLAAASAVLSLVTMLGDTFFSLDISIYFGVLHCFTVSVLLFAVLQLLLKDKAKYACLGIGILLFVWGLAIDYYTVPPLYPAWDKHAVTFTDWLRLAVGLNCYGADSFGILPHTGIFLIGCYGGAQLYARKLPYLPILSRAPFRPFSFVGRKAVWFYLLHQPVVFALVALLGLLCGVRII